MRVVLVLVLVASGLAGCMGGSSEGGSLASSASTVSAAAQDGVLRALNSPTTPTSITTSWHNGTLEPSDNTLFGLDPSRRILIDISDQLPPDQPVHLAIRFSASTMLGSVWAFLDMAGDDLHFIEETWSDQGDYQLEAIVNRGQSSPVRVVVEYGAPEGPAIAYSLSVKASMDSGLVLPRAPTQIDVPPGGLNITMEKVATPTLGEQGAASYTLWDNRGQAILREPLGTRSTTLALAEGRHVVMMSAGAGFHRFLVPNATQDSVTLRPLKIVKTKEAPTLMTGPEPVRIELALDGNQVSVGAYWGTPTGTTGYHTEGGHLSVKTPSGAPVLETDWACTCNGAVYNSGPWASTLHAAGTYLLEYESINTLNMAVGFIIVRYVP